MSKINVAVNEFKIGLDSIEYTFRLDFRALLKFTKRYKDALVIFNEFLTGKDIYGCIVKILSCSCLEKEFTEDELVEQLSFDFKTMKLMDEITFALIDGVLSEDKGDKKSKSGKENKTSKN
ncbi:hypothetical protein [Desulfitobacterium sp. PCE1]|uniref:hypothetical protein n=1 Tax=Desulfitobacterium sp. PCE1 TaxID=146907 RepID=UPI0003796F3D|nr:hypothetical protein [Desulfitobacterium sp. PCE1]